MCFRVADCLFLVCSELLGAQPCSLQPADSHSEPHERLEMQYYLSAGELACSLGCTVLPDTRALTSVVPPNTC